MRHAVPFSLCVAVALVAAPMAAEGQTTDPSPSQREGTTPSTQPESAPPRGSSTPTSQPSSVRPPALLTPGAVGPSSDGLLFAPTQFQPSPALPSEQRPVDSTSIARQPAPRQGEGGAAGSSGALELLQPCGVNGTAGQPSGTATAPQNGVSTSQTQGTGVAAEKFVRPGVSTAQLATLLPGAARAACLPPRTFVLYPETTERPRRAPTTDDGN
jgi:hypothetical protein